MFRTKTSIMLLLGAVALVCPMASGGTIQLTLGSYGGPAAPAGWNQIQYCDNIEATTDLLYTDDTSSNISVTLSGWVGQYVNDGMTTGTSSALFPLGDPVTMRGFWAFGGTGNDPGVLTFGNLDADTEYQFSIYASSQDSNAALTSYQCFGATTSTLVSLDPADNEDGYVTTGPLKADGSGNIALEVTTGLNPAFHKRVYINAVVIEEIPEPATMSMLAMGGLAALIRRRKK